MNESLVHPLALTFTALLCVALLRVPRAHAILPFALAACLIPATHRLVVAGLDLTMLRLILLVGWIRVLGFGEARGFRFVALDGVVLAWAVTAGSAFAVREASFDAVVNRAGVAFDTLGTYFLFRIFLRDLRGIFLAITTLGGVAVLMALTMGIENATGRNLFYLLGGVPEMTWVRDGRLRCRGAFPHPIMAGTFGATIAPLMIAYWVARPGSRAMPTAGFVGCTLVTVYAASSGALLAYLAGIGAWTLWLARDYMRPFRWALFTGALAIHFARERPIWHLLTRLASLVGGEGHHRYLLIDSFIRDWREWWMLGTRSTRHWGWLNSQDITNQYVLEGIRGGIGALGWFAGVAITSYRTISQALVAIARAPTLSDRDRHLASLVAWSLGCSLTVHLVGFISVSYFGQMSSMFYWLLAMIGSLYASVRVVPEASERAPALHPPALMQTR